MSAQVERHGDGRFFRWCEGILDGLKRRFGRGEDIRIWTRDSVVPLPVCACPETGQMRVWRGVVAGRSDGRQGSRHESSTERRRLRDPPRGGRMEKSAAPRWDAGRQDRTRVSARSR